MDRNFVNFGSPSKKGKLVVNAGKIFNGIEFYDMNSNLYKFSYEKSQQFLEKIIPNGEEIVRFCPNRNKKYFEIPRVKVEQLKKIILEAEKFEKNISLVYHREF